MGVVVGEILGGIVVGVGSNSGSRSSNSNSRMLLIEG